MVSLQGQGTTTPAKQGERNPDAPQPLSYQMLPSSCWVTSVTNGLLCLFGTIDDIPDSGLVSRLLLTVLTDEGVDDVSGWETILKAIARLCDLKCTIVPPEKVEQKLATVNFKRSVAICGNRANTHSILINHKQGKWFFGFDPCWDLVSGKPGEGEYELFPQDVDGLPNGWVNFKVHTEHLFLKRFEEDSHLLVTGAPKKRSLAILSRWRK